MPVPPSTAKPAPAINARNAGVEDQIASGTKKQLLTTSELHGLESKIKISKVSKTTIANIVREMEMPEWQAFIQIYLGKNAQVKSRK